MGNLQCRPDSKKISAILDGRQRLNCIRTFSLVCFVVVISAIASSPCVAEDRLWGTLKGRVVLDGDLPKIIPLVAKGAAVKDPICAAKEIPDEKIVVDPDSKGMANVVVYLLKRPAVVHPDLELIVAKSTKVQKPEGDKPDDPKAKDDDDAVTIETKECRFVPHVIFAQVGQKIRVVNKDKVPHNFHSNPVKNTPDNFILKPNDDQGIFTRPLSMSERFPFKANCDIHPWMTMHIMVLNHPYCAITDANGRYEIPKLPVGNHEFIFWHETGGYVEKKFAVTIKEGVNEQEEMTVAVQ